VVGVPSPTTGLLEVGGGTPTSREKYLFQVKIQRTKKPNTYSLVSNLPKF